MKITRSCFTSICLVIRVDKVTIDIMFQYEAGRIKPAHFILNSPRPGQKLYIRVHIPVIEDLTTHYMSANSPAILITLLTKVIVTKKLCIKVISLIRRMVNMRHGTLEEEEAMMIH